MHVINIDPSKPLSEEPRTGHNRWHEEVEPILEVEPGETVVFGTRAGLDAQVKPTSTSEDVGRFDRTRVHPLTGPVHVSGAEPGDLLCIEVLAVIPDPWEQRAFTICSPRIGFLGSEVPGELLVHWRLHGMSYADSPQLPGVRIPASPFPGTLGVAPSREVRLQATDREPSFPPEEQGAVPSEGRVALEGLRTLPPRENGGNLDAKLLTAGSTLLLPVLVEGGLVSVGDVHYAQGDGEACGTAIEMHSQAHLRFSLRKGEGRVQMGARLVRRGYGGPGLDHARFFATTGIAPRGGNRSGDGIEAAAREALLRMIDYLGSRGFDAPQANVLCSVAVDLRITQVVNPPTVGVTAVLPLDIFVDGPFAGDI